MPETATGQAPNASGHESPGTQQPAAAATAQVTAAHGASMGSERWDTDW